MSPSRRPQRRCADRVAFSRLALIAAMSASSSLISRIAASVFSLPTVGVAGGEGDGKMRRANPEPETEPTKEPNAAAKATLAASIANRLERAGVAAAATPSGALSLTSSWFALMFGATIAGRLMMGDSPASVAVAASPAAA